MSASNGTTVLITGAARGIGRGLAERFLADGWSVLATVRSDADAAAVRDAHRGAGERLEVARLDVTDERAVRAFADGVRARGRRLDVLYNNAGLFDTLDRGMRADELEVAVLRRTLETNLFGTVAMCVAFAPLVRDGGRIVNVSSTMGQLDDGGLMSTSSAYSVSKTAVNAYSSALAKALASRNVVVDAIHPGWVQTDMGGPGAQITVDESVADVAWHATRPREAGPSGAFWHRRRVIPW